jgi:hypothetical protein
VRNTFDKVKANTLAMLKFHKRHAWKEKNRNNGSFSNHFPSEVPQVPATLRKVFRSLGKGGLISVHFVPDYICTNYNTTQHCSRVA